MIITFCGHSNLFATEELEIKMLALLEEIIGKEPAEIYLGDYGDFDAMAYKCCKKFKEVNPNISLLFVTPYITEEYQRNRLRHLEGKYDAIIYPQIEDKPLRFAITYRNRWMIDKADCLICAISHTFGGAYKTFMYAKRKKKPIYNLAVGGIT